MTTTNTLNPFNPNVVKDDTNKKWKKRLWLAGLALLTILSAKTAIWQEVVTQETSENNKELPIELHGSIWGWSNVTPLLWSELSKTPAVRMTINITNPKTWLSIDITRFDDFNASKEKNASQLNMADIYKQFELWNRTITPLLEYTYADKIEGSHGLTPILWLSYDAWKWWIFDARGCYTFQKWDNEAAFRVWVTKILNECTSLAIQAIYNGWKLTWRAQAKILFWNGFSAELSFIGDTTWKVTPTIWAMYKF